METAAKRIESIDATIARMRREIRTLNAKKKKLEKELAEGMRRRKITQYGSFSLAKLDPPKKPRRKPQETQKQIVKALSDLGVADPITAAAKIREVTARRPPGT